MFAYTLGMLHWCGTFTRLILDRDLRCVELNFVRPNEWRQQNRSYVRPLTKAMDISEILDP